jgi:hypothetical protein
VVARSRAAPASRVLQEVKTEFFCVSCRESVEEKVSSVCSYNGTKFAFKGECSQCGTNLTRFTSKPTVEAMVAIGWRVKPMAACKPRSAASPAKRRRRAAASPRK